MSNINIKGEKTHIEHRFELKTLSVDQLGMNIMIFLVVIAPPILTYAIMSYFEFSDLASAFVGLVIMSGHMFVWSNIDRHTQTRFIEATYESTWAQTEVLLDRLNVTR